MYLLDTNVLIWWVTDNDKLSDRARSIIRDPENQIFVSAASVWEIAIKSSLGKLEISKHFYHDLAKEPFTELSVSFQHAILVRDLPHIHADPFDRLLIAQARVENLTVITSDPSFKRYEIAVIKAKS